MIYILNKIPSAGPNAKPAESAAPIFQRLLVAWRLSKSLTVSAEHVLENTSPTPAINLPTKR